MGKSEDGSNEIAEVVKPETTIELLKRPEPASNNIREEGRTLSLNETKPEAKQEFQIAFNFENKSVSAKESENKLNNTVEKTEQKEQKSVEPKSELKEDVKLDIKPESGKNWAEHLENTKRQFDNERNKIENKSNSFEVTSFSTSALTSSATSSNHSSSRKLITFSAFSLLTPFTSTVIS